MKKCLLPVYSFALIFLSSLLLISSCKKADDEEEEGSFTWNYKGVDYTANYTLAHSIEDLGPNIIGGLGNSAIAPGSGPQFKIIPLTTGLYTVGPGENPVEFIDTDGFSLPAVGLITITSIANKKLSATFIVEIGMPGNQNTLTGTISNIPITP